MTTSPAPEASAVIAPASVAAIPAKAGIPRSVALFAAILLLPAAPAAAEELGRLFFTPERRAALERQRQFNIREAEARAVEVGATLSVSGVVQRSSGKTTTWVNNAPQDEKESAGVRVEIDRANPGRTTVIAGEEEPAHLNVGETINRSTRETTTGVGAGRITVKRDNARTK